MLTKTSATARRRPTRGGLAPRSLMRGLIVTLFPAALVVLAGCEKPPTWDELIHGKKPAAAPAPAPVAKQAPPAKAAAQSAPREPEAPKRTAQEALSQFANTPSYKRTNAQLTELASLPEARDQITDLELQGSMIDDTGFAQLPKFEKVEKLNIGNMNYSNAALGNVAQMKGVTTLIMTKGPQKEKNCDAGLAHLTQMKQLVDLQLDQSKFSTAGVAEIAKMTQLEKLSVSMVAVFSDENLETLAPLVNLKYLDLTNSLVTDDGLKYLVPFTELDTLKIAKMHGVRGRGLKELVLDRKGLRKLTNLSIYDNPYLTIDAYIGISHIKTLVSLDVGAANCSNEAFVGAMPPLKNLQYLSVHENEHLTDEAMIQAFPKLRKLKSIYFHNNKLISDGSIKAFAQVKTLEAITLLDTAVTPTGALTLKKKLRNTKVNYNGKNL
jgi:Leucine-rich repeat (LRR) protein